MEETRGWAEALPHIFPLSRQAGGDQAKQIVINFQKKTTDKFTDLKYHVENQKEGNIYLTGW